VKILSVVGARPQFIKLAPIDRALRERGNKHVIVHTGQHYDRLMSQAFFDDLAIEPPIANLGVGSAGHAVQTARMLTALDPVLYEQRPDWVLVYGDTTTTLAGALAAAQRGLPLAHLEAGLRAFDRIMPEERNRVVADHLSDLLLAPTPVAVRNLAAEGLRPRAVLVGDVMVDTLRAMQQKIALTPKSYVPAFLRDRPYFLATVHRQETTDDPVHLAATIQALSGCPLPVQLIAHPRLRDKAARLGIPLTGGTLHVTEPLQYPSMIAAMVASRGLITDSGGLQKEALLLGVPCTTLRSRTEWPETLQDGWNVLVSDPQNLVAAVSRPMPLGPPPEPFGDGAAASRVVAELAAAQRGGSLGTDLSPPTVKSHSTSEAVNSSIPDTRGEYR
jgi:UDP-N-acetylglucosamine 2-epimerase (non-hydrolysing)